MEAQKVKQKTRFYVSSIRSYVKLRNSEVWNATGVKDAVLLGAINRVKQDFERINDNYTFDRVCEIIEKSSEDLRIITQNDHRPNSNLVKMIKKQIWERKEVKQ